MRLTLRTLLAYLDDTLDPAQTKEIGQKVSESTAAQELIAKIKEVVRRRRLTTPPTTGPTAKLDANTVSEYIDNVLTPDQLAEVEEIYLESDVYLAEVAACHQILTVILSEPALVPPTAKRRMYALVKGREAMPYRKAKPVGAGIDYGPEGEGQHEEDETLLLGLPMLLKKGGWFRRIAPAAAVLVLVAGLAVAIWQALPGDRQKTKGSGDKVASLDEAKQKQSTDKAADQSSAKEDKSKDAVKPDGSAEKKADSSVEKKQDSATEKKADADVGKKPDSTAEKKPDTGTETKPDTATPTPPAAGVRKEAGKYILVPKGDASFLVTQRTKDGPWSKAAPDATVFTEDRLMSFPGYRSEIQFNNGAQLSLWGHPPGQGRAFTLESEVALHDNSSYDLDLTLFRGRIALINNKPEGSMRVRVRFLGESWVLNLLEPKTEFAMELWGDYPPGVQFSKDMHEGPMMVAALFGLKGAANLMIRYETYLMRELPGKNFFFWDNTGPASRTPAVMAEAQLMSWARKDAPKLPKELRTALDALQKNLLASPSVDDALSESLRVKDKDKSTLRSLAVVCLGAINDLPKLLDCLASEQFPDVRRAAILTLRHWIGLGEENDLILYRVLENKYKGGEAEIIMSLLHGFLSDRDRLDPTTYEALIAYLKHNKLAIREMAYWQLALLVPEGASKIPYDAASPEAQRDKAFDAWKKLVPEGKLPQVQRGAPPAGRN